MNRRIRPRRSTSSGDNAAELVADTVMCRYLRYGRTT
jgi:hypothetical protein